MVAVRWPQNPAPTVTSFHGTGVSFHNLPIATAPYLKIRLICVICEICGSKSVDQGYTPVMELLAPAGDPAALHAALEAGASAVYLGLRALHARRRARNFAPDELLPAVQAAHARGAKLYLTLNIDLTERDLGQMARSLELAQRCGVDAVLVRDPAWLLFRPHYPKLAWHLSTQTCMASSADVAAARDLGATRVVLARELTLAEIAAASAVAGVPGVPGVPGVEM